MKHRFIQRAGKSLWLAPTGMFLTMFCVGLFLHDSRLTSWLVGRDPSEILVDPHAEAVLSEMSGNELSVREYCSLPSRSVSDRIDIAALLDSWLTSNPVDCGNALRRLGALQLLGSESLFSAIESYGVDSSSARFRTATSVDDPVVRDNLELAAVRGAMSTNLELALDLFGSLPRHLKASVSDELARLLGASPANLIKLINHPNMDRGLLFGSLEKWSESDSAGCLKFFDSLTPMQLSRFKTSKTYIFEKIQFNSDPQVILEYLSGKPVSQSVTTAATNALGTLLAAEPKRLQEFADQSKTGLPITAIAANAAVKAVANSGDAAMALLQVIPGLRARTVATRAAARAFLEKVGIDNPKIIEEWAKSSNDPSIQETILQEARFQGVKLP